MNKAYHIVLGLFILAALMCLGVSCNSSQPEKKTIAVSILPQKYFLEKIVGDKYAVTCLLSQGGNPEAYEPDMAHLMNLEKSDAFFKIGNIGFELAIADKVRNNNPDLKLYDTSRGIALIHGSHTVSDGHNHGIDPHIWSSVANARIIAKNMLEAVQSLDPKHSKFYAKNFDALEAELDSLDAKITRMLEPYKGTSFVVWHPSLSYFARDYGLHQISLEYDGKEASAGHLKSKIDEAVSDSVKVFFFQNEFDSRQIEAVNSQIHAKVVTINLLSYDWDNEMLNIANAIANQ